MIDQQNQTTNSAKPNQVLSRALAAQAVRPQSLPTRRAVIGKFVPGRSNN